MLYLKPDTLLVGLAGKTLQFLLTKVSRFPPIYRASFDTGTDSWEFGLLKELKSMGYSIDFNKMDI